MLSTFSFLIEALRICAKVIYLSTLSKFQLKKKNIITWGCHHHYCPVLFYWLCSFCLLFNYGLSFLLLRGKRFILFLTFFSIRCSLPQWTVEAETSKVKKKIFFASTEENVKLPSVLWVMCCVIFVPYVYILKLWPKISTLVSSDHNIFFHMLLRDSMYVSAKLSQP